MTDTERLLRHHLETALNFIEHSEANRGKITDADQWAQNVVDYRESGPTQLGIGRGVVSSASVDLGAIRELLADTAETRGRPGGRGPKHGTLASKLVGLKVGESTIIDAPDRSITSVACSHPLLKGRKFTTTRGRFLALMSDELIHCVAVERIA